MTVYVAFPPVEFVYVITDVPAEIPVTIPEEFTVAIPVFELTHGETNDGVSDPVKLMVDPTHKVEGPEIVGAAFVIIAPDTEVVAVEHVPVTTQ